MRKYEKRTILENTKKLPPGFSIGIPGFSFDPGAFAGHLYDQSNKEELVQLRAQLEEFTRDASEGFRQMAAELDAAGVKSEEQYRDLVTALRNVLAKPEADLLPSCFQPAQDVFSALIARNFLFEFRGPGSDYVELLSIDIRRLFFSSFNEKLRSGKTNRLVVSGDEGSGKTFNLLLLSLQLMREGYSVHYCYDVHSASLTPEAIRSIAHRDDETLILIIDNCQHDLLKTETLTSAISRTGSYEGKPVFIFLTRPLDNDTCTDTFGANTPILYMREHFIEFERLVQLRFEQLGQQEQVASFLKNAGMIRIEELSFKYKNMAFWNEVLRSLDAGSSYPLSQESIFQRAHAFLQKKEMHLLDSREAISRLLPLFCLGVSIQSDYAAELLGDGSEQALRVLESEGLISIVAQDWETQDYDNSSTLVVAPRIHPTKSRMLALIYKKYYKASVDPIEALAAYAARFPHCLYHILGRYTGIDEARVLFSNAAIQHIVKHYFFERHLGKKLDRVIRRIDGLDDSILNVLIDDTVIQAFADKINEDHAYIVSKLYAFRSLLRISPQKAYQLFGLMTVESVTQPFLKDETEGGVTSLAKWMELFKNIYYYAPTAEAKEVVREFVRTVIIQCRQEFVRRFELRDHYFTNLHWLLKRLHGMKLANYFLEGIEPTKLIELIRAKDTNIVELCKSVLTDSQFAFCIDPDGVRRRYSDILSHSLTYEDLKRVFDNKRSDLFDLAINATNYFIAMALARYADDPEFVQKAKRENDYLLNESIKLITTNYFLNEEEKAKIIKAIMKADRAA